MNATNTPVTAEEIALVDVLVWLNLHYGRGDVVRVVWNGESPENCEGTFIRKPFACDEEVRRFRVTNGIVFALGHQRNLKRAW